MSARKNVMNWKP